MTVRSGRGVGTLERSRGAGGRRSASILAGAAVASLVGFVTIPRPAIAALVSKVIATVDGEPITSFQLDQFIRVNAPNVDPESIGAADRQKALEMLILDRLVEVESSGSPVPDAEVDRYIEGIKQKNKLDDAQLDEALKAQGLTVESYREQVRKEIAKSKLVGKQLQGKVSVTPEDVDRYYDEHKSEFASADSVRVRQIFFRVPPDASPSDVAAVAAKAQAARERVEKGDAFEKVAAEVSESPDARSGGDLGRMKKGQMFPELETVIFAMKEGEVSPPVRTRAGVHVVKVEEKIGETQDGDVEKIKLQIKEKLYSEAMESKFQRYVLEDLKKGHEIVVK